MTEMSESLQTEEELRREDRAAQERIERFAVAADKIDNTEVTESSPRGEVFVTVSTSGVVPEMDRLREACPVALAVSLHAPNDALRDQLVPVNRKYPLRELIAACNRYLEKAPRDFVTFEYVMLDGVNDADEHARELVELSRRVRCKFNLIPFNPFRGSNYRRSDAERIRRFAAILQRAGLTVTTRKTRGDDIAAACGQLAGDVADRTRRRATVPLREVRA